MNDLVVVEKIAQWRRLKALVLDSVSSPITRRVYNMALDEFMAWFRQEPHPGGFCKATVSAWRASLETRGLGSSSIIIRMSAIRKLAGEAVDSIGWWSVKCRGEPTMQVGETPASSDSLVYTPLLASCAPRP